MFSAKPIPTKPVVAIVSPSRDQLHGLARADDLAGIAAAQRGDQWCCDMVRPLRAC